MRSDVPWGHKNNHAMFEAARERSLQVALHAWGRAGKSPTPSGFTTTYLEDYIANQPIAQAQMLSFVSEGVFERFPDLRVMVTECGFAWLPRCCGALTRTGRACGARCRGSRTCRRSTSAALLPHHRARAPAARCRARAQLLEMLGGSAMLAYASDFPHDHGDERALLDRLGDEQRRRLMWGTAAEVYGLDDG